MQEVQRGEEERDSVGDEQEQAGRIKMRTCYGYITSKEN